MSTVDDVVIRRRTKSERTVSSDDESGLLKQVQRREAWLEEIERVRQENPYPENEEN